MPLSRAIAAPASRSSGETSPTAPGAALSIGLSAVIVAASIQEPRECVDETRGLTMLSFVTPSQHVTPHTATPRHTPARPCQGEPSCRIAQRFVWGDWAIGHISLFALAITSLKCPEGHCSLVVEVVYTSIGDTDSSTPFADPCGVGRTPGGSPSEYDPHRKAFIVEDLLRVARKLHGAAIPASHVTDRSDQRRREPGCAGWRRR